MKVRELAVRRLVSGPGFSNAAVELRAELEEGDDVEEVFKELAVKACAYVRLVPAIDELEVVTAEVEEREKEIKEEVKKLYGLLKEYRELRNELRDEVSRWEKEVEELRAELEKRRSVIRAIKEKLGIRSD